MRGMRAQADLVLAPRAHVEFETRHMKAVLGGRAQLRPAWALPRGRRPFHWIEKEKGVEEVGLVLRHDRIAKRREDDGV